jgi:glutathione S-transferase
MDLYYSPMACSLAARIVCIEAGLAVTMLRTDLGNKRVEGASEGALLQYNGMGKVPTLVCDDGHVLTENVAVLLYLGDRADSALGLTPPHGTPERYEVVRWLAFVATEIHKRVLATVYSLDRPSDAVKAFARSTAAQPLTVLQKHLRDREVLVGEEFTVADAYLVWALLLLPRAQVPMDSYPALGDYLARNSNRAAVRAAVQRELEEYRVPGWWTAKQLE